MARTRRLFSCIGSLRKVSHTINSTFQSELPCSYLDCCYFNPYYIYIFIFGGGLSEDGAFYSFTDHTLPYAISPQYSLAMPPLIDVY